MSLRTVATVCAGITVFSAIVAASLWRDLRTEREQTALLRSRLEESVARTQSAPPSPAQQEAEAPVAVTAAVTPPVVPAPATAPVALSAAASALVATQALDQRELLKDPEYRDAQQAMLRSSLPQTYPGLAEELGLSAEEADRVFDLLAQHQMAMSAQPTVLTSTQQPDPAQVAETMRNRQAVQQQQATALREVLGETRYAQWESYQQTRMPRLQANSWANTLAQSGAPLNDTQLKSLVNATIAEQGSMQRDMREITRTIDPANPQARVQMQQAMQQRQSETNQRILESASAQLSAQQVAALQAQFEQQAAMSSARQRVMERAQAPAAGP